MKKPLPHPAVRFWWLIFVAVPSTLGVMFGGLCLALLIFGPKGTGTLESQPVLFWIITAISPFSLLLALGQWRQPLYLIFYYSVPFVLASQYFIAKESISPFRYFVVFGYVVPYLLYRWLRKHYQKPAALTSSKPDSFE